MVYPDINKLLLKILKDLKIIVCVILPQIKLELFGDVFILHIFNKTTRKKLFETLLPFVL